MKFVRLFINPIGITLSILIFTDMIESLKDGVIIFSLAFTFNWIADKTIIERAIRSKKDK